MKLALIVAYVILSVAAGLLLFLFTVCIGAADSRKHRNEEVVSSFKHGLPILIIAATIVSTLTWALYTVVSSQ